MDDTLIELILLSNPWLKDAEQPYISGDYWPRIQQDYLMLPEWDDVWTILVGPRQAGKTTLGFMLAEALKKAGRFKTLLYLNCDFQVTREWLKTPLFLQQAMKKFDLQQPILFIDEVQRLENPGLLLKSIVDLKLPVKLIASGSLQLEMKSKVQEFLTGRHIVATILPLSQEEAGDMDESAMLYGMYPSVLRSTEKQVRLRGLYQDYIDKDIIEILKISKPDIMQRLIGLVANSAGQLVNYQRLATDVQTTTPTAQGYLSILEKTFTIQKITPYVGNKRKEIVANPVYYFVDNGFRNQALNNFTALEGRTDAGLLFEGYVFQALLKLKVQYFLNFNIHFWRTQSGAEVDFVLDNQVKPPVPIEVKFQRFKKPALTRSFHSFLGAYKPQIGFVITESYNHEMMVGDCLVHFVSRARLVDGLTLLRQYLST